MKKTILALCAAFGCFLPLAAEQYVANPNYYAPSSCCDQPVCDPWYLFAGVVHTGLFDDRYRVTEVGDADPITNTGRSNNLGWEVFLGYKFSHCFGLELGYVDLARQRAGEFVTLRIGDFTEVFSLTGHYRTYVVPLRSNFSLNFCNLTLSALFGVHYYNSRGSLTTVSGAETITRFKTGVDFNFGAAVEYRFIEWLGLRLDMTRYYIKHYDDQENDYADAVTANLVTYF